MQNDDVADVVVILGDALIEQRDIGRGEGTIRKLVE